MELQFQISSYDPEALAPQVSQALEQRTQRLSRAQYPAVWALTDRLQTPPAVPDTVRHRRRVRLRIYGVLLLALGIFLLVPGLMEPQTLLVPLLAGGCGVVLGLWSLWMGFCQPHRSFDQAVQTLLKGLEGLETASPLLVRFTPAGLEAPGRAAVPYSAFDCVAETRDLFLLTWEGSVLLLQKKDLVSGTVEDFRALWPDRSGPSPYLSLLP